ncbi:unnamed protein product [Protopolystoma xenopodis]|uniref:Secreted protein n=1 Tax=Protopolystoma xenopodis TaxID=117903 RepID=A0A3S5ADR3_9PLAT|nr:unnamed protein product [Protopolystoma xenopodis]
MQLVRAGVLGLSRPWCLNFAAWLINTLVFGVENRSEHLALRLGDFRIVTHLPHTAATQANVHGPAGDAGLAREYVHFTNRATGSEFYLAGSATLTATTERQHGVRGRRDREVRRLRGGKSPGISMVESELNLPCPVAVFKELRSRRPGSCMEPFSKLYLQVLLCID